MLTLSCPPHPILDWAETNKWFLGTVGTAITAVLNFTNMLKGWNEYQMVRLKRLQETAVPEVRSLQIGGLVQPFGDKGGTLNFRTIPMRNVNKYWRARPVRAALKFYDQNSGAEVLVNPAMWIGTDGKARDFGLLDGDAVVVWACSSVASGAFIPGVSRGTDGEVSAIIAGNGWFHVYTIEDGEWVLDIQLDTDNFIGNEYFQLIIKKAVGQNQKNVENQKIVLDRPCFPCYAVFMDTNNNPTTLLEAVEFFSVYANCHNWMVAKRWPDGVIRCPRCESTHVAYLEKARVWKCYGKHKSPKFSLKVGTIFEDSPIGLEKWLPAVWLLASCKNGISSYELHRALGVTQKTAWFMLHRIRYAMQTGSFMKLKGEVEVDETFIGGKARFMHVGQRQRRITGTGGKDKTAVMGLLERGGDIRTAVVENRSKSVLQSEVKKQVEAGSALYSDALLSYEGLASEYAHKVIDHAVAYVDGQVHTNGLENFWSLLKRSINGTYVSVEPFHLFRYLDEQTFRYNQRKLNDGQRFAGAVGQIMGRRLTYKQLTGYAK